MNSNALAHRASRLVGRVLRDKWHIDALVGVGGMASVFAATHRNGKRVAIKLLHPELSIDSETRSRFLREGYVGNEVGHPGVVSVLDDDTTDEGLAFLVMDLLEGETLKARWIRAGRRLPVEEVLRIAHAILDVLATAHEKGIVHRDLKPDNVFLTSDGGVKVLDFGIARLREVSEPVDATRSSAMLGTPAYMAPEQARSRWDWVDARTDLWALGATMFTTLSGELVHDAETVTEVLVAAATERPKPVLSVLPSLPGAVGAIINRALAFERDARWPDARSMQAAISAALAAGVRGEAGPVLRAQPMPAAEPSNPLPSWSGAAPASTVDSKIGPTIMMTESGITSTRNTQGVRSKHGGFALALAAGAGALVVAAVVGVVVLARGTGADSTGGATSAAPVVEPGHAPTVAAAPTAASEASGAGVAPPVESPTASAPVASAGVVPSPSVTAASGRPTDRRPPRAGTPSGTTTAKSGNPLDKY